MIPQKKKNDGDDDDETNCDERETHTILYDEGGGARDKLTKPVNALIVAMDFRDYYGS